MNQMLPGLHDTPRSLRRNGACSFLALAWGIPLIIGLVGMVPPAADRRLLEIGPTVIVLMAIAALSHFANQLFESLETSKPPGSLTILSLAMWPLGPVILWGLVTPILCDPLTLGFVWGAIALSCSMQGLWPISTIHHLADTNSSAQTRLDHPSKISPLNTQLSDEIGPSTVLNENLEQTSNTNLIATDIGDETEHSGCSSWIRAGQNDDGGRWLEGEQTVCLQPGERESELHIPFNPPFVRKPAVYAEESQGADVTVDVSAVFTYGCRLVIRRPMSQNSISQTFSVAFSVSDNDAAQDQAA